MKALSISIFLTALLVFFIACDKVKNPRLVTQSNTGNTVTHQRKVLVEDYTGHRCGNCPAAALVAEQLEKDNKGKVFVVAVHAGFFSNTNASYPTSYTTTAGNEWDGASGFDVSKSGNPNGMVNRKAYDGSLLQKETKWPSSVAQALTDTCFLTLSMDKNYDEANRKLSISVKSKFIREYPRATKVSVILLEDSIIGPHLDYSKSPSYIPDYVFMHMLRGSLNGAWGDDVKSGAAMMNDSVINTYTNFDINPAFKDHHMSVLAFVHDATTRVVLQVEKVKLK